MHYLLIPYATTFSLPPRATPIESQIAVFLSEAPPVEPQIPPTPILKPFSQYFQENTCMPTLNAPIDPNATR